MSTSPTKTLEIARQQINEAMKAIVALEQGHITVKECLSIMTSTLDWLKLALDLQGKETPIMPILLVFEPRVTRT